MHPASISTDIQTRPEAEPEMGAVEAIHHRAFGESGEKIVALLRALRHAPAALAPVSLVAVRGDVPIGHILLSAGRLDAAPRLVDVFTLSPLAVDPTQQRRGVGTALIAAALQEADRQGCPSFFSRVRQSIIADAGLSGRVHWDSVRRLCAFRTSLSRSLGYPGSSNG